MSQATDNDPELAAKLRERLRDDPAGLIRDFPDVAQRVIDKARLDGNHKLADRMENLMAQIQEEEEST